MAADERRRQIVQVAMRLFSERGFRGTTTKEIAQAAGVSEAIIFRHFATKEELYTAIIDHKSCGHAPGEGDAHPLAETLKCAVGEAVARKDDRAVFEGLAREMMRYHVEDPHFLRLVMYSALEGHQLAEIFWDRNVRMLYDFFGAYIRERQGEGVFREVDPLVVVRAFTGMIIHHSLNNTLWDKARTILDISDEEAARQFTEIILSGIASDGGAKTSANANASPVATTRRAGATGQAKRKRQND
jgi:AcrR family transcriptional regulator